MRCGAFVLAVAAALSSAILASGAAFAQQSFTPITPQTSNVTSAVTTCMMSCNSTVAQCQTNCVVPGASGASVAAQTTGTASIAPGSVGSSCQLACTTAQLTCQTACSQKSPSR